MSMSREFGRIAPYVAFGTLVALGGTACGGANTPNTPPPLMAKVENPSGPGYTAILQDGTKVTLANGTPVDAECDVTVDNTWGIQVVIEGGAYKGKTTGIPRHDLQNTNNPYDPTNQSDPFGALDLWGTPIPPVVTPTY